MIGNGDFDLFPSNNILVNSEVVAVVMAKTDPLFLESDSTGSQLIHFLQSYSIMLLVVEYSIRG